jgi:hypothetical protein
MNVPRQLSIVCLALLANCATPSYASFIGSYQVSNWVLQNQSANGSVDTSGAPASVILTGGDDNSGNSGFTLWTTTAADSGTVSVNWSYTSTDFAAADDPFNYILKNTVTPVFESSGLSSASGTLSFAVAAGDKFGFQIATLDNLFGPGVVTLSNFDVTAVPEPAGIGLAIVASSLLGLMRLRQR